MMKLILTLLLLPLFPLVCKADDSGETVVMIDALKKYREALVAGKTEAAVALTASFPDLPVEAVKSKTGDYVEAARTGRLKIWIFPTSAKVIDGCGALIIGDGEEPAADDPAYMIKQADGWKVLLKLTDWNRPFFKHSDEQKKAFEHLQTHVAEQMKYLRAASSPKAE
jgi:hypothetical protein